MSDDTDDSIYVDDGGQKASQGPVGTVGQTGTFGPYTISNGSIFINGKPYTTYYSTTNPLLTTPAEIVVKTSVKYVIIKDDESCLELDEQQTMTPREMLGICKFINLAHLATAEDADVCFNWSKLSEKLGIQRHFKAGLATHLDYDDDGDVLHLFLFDEDA